MFKGFNLPTYKEIPAVGLYLDQTSKYINECLQDLPDCNITNSMISNYVKHHLISNPVKKQYSRDQIACLIFIAVTKNTLSLDEVAAVFEMQKEKCEVRDAYSVFASTFESFLKNGNQLLYEENDSSDLKLLKRIVITVVNHFYLNEELKGRK